MAGAVIAVILSVAIPVMLAVIVLPIAGALFGLGFWWSKKKLEERPARYAQADDEAEEEDEAAENTGADED